MSTLVLLVIVGAVGITAVGRRWIHQSSLIVVVVAAAVSFIPAVPRVELEPHLIFSLVMPPLLYSAARQFSVFSFLRHLRPIVVLGLGLVVVTTAAVAGLTAWIAPALGASGALILAAVVSPPDTVTTVTHGRAIGLPKRVVDILTGECLINDAAALTIFAVAAAQVTGRASFIANPVLLFLYGAVVGVVVGIVLSAATSWITGHLPDDTLATALTVLMPFTCYLLAEQLQASGVLAVVAAGFTSAVNTTFDEDAQAPLSYRLRVRELEFWPVIDVLLEAFVFSYMGLQLRHVVVDLTHDAVHLPLALGLGLSVLALVMAVRVAWVFLMFGGNNLIHRWRARKVARFLAAARTDPAMRARLAAFQEHQRQSDLRSDERARRRLEVFDQRVQRAEAVAARMAGRGSRGRAAQVRAATLRARALELRGMAVAGNGMPGDDGQSGDLPGCGRATGSAESRDVASRDASGAQGRPRRRADRHYPALDAVRHADHHAPRGEASDGVRRDDAPSLNAAGGNVPGRDAPGGDATGGMGTARRGAERQAEARYPVQEAVSDDARRDDARSLDAAGGNVPGRDGPGREPPGCDPTGGLGAGRRGAERQGSASDATEGSTADATRDAVQDAANIASAIRAARASRGRRGRSLDQDGRRRRIGAPGRTASGYGRPGGGLDAARFGHERPMGWREMLLVSWTGMRGIVTLAVAAEVPVVLDTPGLPGRSLIQAVAFMVAIGTLLIQGSTLGFLARRLGIDLSGEDGAASEAMDHAEEIASAAPADQFEERRTLIRGAVLRGELDDQTGTRAVRCLDFEEAAANV
ncbi:MAG: cation:proton antiporter [Bifidobacteriaceae bacterium]|jgi:CPA1 family monovalent cation:H+ antiporter|nr:cation:proton antiporter [Bifidobacteriaceae bacterium]